MNTYPAPMQHNFSFNPAAPGSSMHARSSNNSSTLTTDQNSPELFKLNLANAQREVLRTQGLARDALSAIQNAYHPGQSPANTSKLISDLKAALEDLVQVLRTTGVGALPVLPGAGTPGARVPTEAQLLAEASSSVRVLYDALKRKQESAAVVANLLGSDQRGR